MVLGYFRPHSLSKLSFGLFLLAGGSDASVAGGEHWWVDTRAEARATATDNAFLTEANRFSDLVLNVSPGLNARWESKRITAGVDYALDYFYFFSDQTTDVRQSGFATLDAEVIEDHLSIVGRASLREKFLSQRGAISNNFANRTDNRRLLQNYTGSAILKGGLRDVADWRISYRYGLGRSDADNLLDETLPVNFSDTISNEIVGSITSGKRFNNFVWRLFLNSSRVTRNLEVNDFRNERAGGEITYKFNRFFQVLGSAGFSRNDFQSVILRQDGFTWEAGFRWTPGRKLDMTVLTGREGTRKTWSADVQYFFSPRLVFTGNYRDILSANTIVTNNSLQDFGFDENLGISNSSGLPIDETDPIFTLSDVDFRRQSARAGFTLRQMRTKMSLTANYERRTFDDGTGTATSIGLSYTFDRQITKRSSIKGRTSYRRSRFEGETRVDNYITASLDWTTTLSRYFKAAIGFNHSERQSSAQGSDLEENALTVYLRGTF